jgi:O-antigen ligase
MKTGTIVLTVVLLAMLGFVIWGFQAAWRLSGNVQMSIHGYVAMGLAAGVTLLLGGGLMWLAFYSSRKGWDDIDREGD